MGARCIQCVNPSGEEYATTVVPVRVNAKPILERPPWEDAVEAFPAATRSVRGGGGALDAHAQDAATSSRSWASQPPEPVTLHIYDVCTSGAGPALNRLLRPLGTGVFHCGVEVYGREWAYSDTTANTAAERACTGVFCCPPRNCEGHSYKESVAMGTTSTREGDVLRLLRLLRLHWPIAAYDSLSHNCCHFGNEFCQRLGVGEIPAWVMNLAGAGAAIAETGDTTCCRQVALQAAETICCHDDNDAKVVDGTPFEAVRAEKPHVIYRL